MEEFGQKPSRSDVRLSREQELEAEAKTRDYFDAVTPLRHTKPSRSEYASHYVDTCKTKDPIPELAHFQRLQKDSVHKIGSDGCGVPEEFVETEYYEDLNCVDKQHHTTGSGFIQMEKTGGPDFLHLAPDSVTNCHAACRGNPATNDWVPSATDDRATCTSGKPQRSDN